MKILLRFLIPVWLISVPLFLFVYYHNIKGPINRDVIQPLTSARKATDAEEMLDSVTALESGMRKHGLTLGYATYFNRDPEYSFKRIHEEVEAIKQELEIATGMDMSQANGNDYGDLIQGLHKRCMNLDLHIDKYTWQEFRWVAWITEIMLVLAIIVVAWRREYEIRFCLNRRVGWWGSTQRARMV